MKRGLSVRVPTHRLVRVDNAEVDDGVEVHIDVVGRDRGHALHVVRLLAHLKHLHALNRPRRPQVEARAERGLVAAEALDDDDGGLRDGDEAHVEDALV